MPKVSVIFVIYEAKKYIKPAFGAVFAQTHKDLEVIAIINKSTDGSKEEIAKNYPQVKIIDPGRNTAFAEGNNIGIKASTGEFIQLVNQDLILEPNYIEEILKAFQDPKVAAATGKILRYDFARGEKTKIIDTTGVTMQASGRGRDRGQNEVDVGQFDQQLRVWGVSGASPMYRRSALEQVAYHGEIFDQDFFIYWEDVDLSWRLNHAGFRCAYEPKALGYHGRTAGSSEEGYAHVWKFIQHHNKLSLQVRQWNYKNHFLMYLKNGNLWQPLFWAREIAMLGYVIIFEPRTLKILPELFRQLPKIWKKRQTQMKSAAAP